LKLIIASLPDPCDEVVSKSLVSSAFHVTTIASTSGWLRKGMTTLLVGVQDKQIEKALAIIRKNCTEKGKSFGQHRSSIFVMKVNEYIHF
jgi:uncharacterized protein YaaQ